MKLTKKYMLEDYPRLERKCGLLDLYLYDSLNEQRSTARRVRMTLRIGARLFVNYSKQGMWPCRKRAQPQYSAAQRGEP